MRPLELVIPGLGSFNKVLNAEQDLLDGDGRFPAFVLVKNR